MLGDNPHELCDRETLGFPAIPPADPTGWTELEQLFACRFGDPVQRALQRRKVYGLDEVIVEAGGDGALSIVRLAVSSQGDEAGALELWHCAQPLRQLVAVHFGKPDVEQHHLGLKGAYAIQRVLAVVDGLGLVPLEIKKNRKRSRSVHVIVHYQHTAGSWLGQIGLRAFRLLVSNSRQPDLERRTLTDSRAVCTNCSAMHLDQSLDDGKPNAEASLSAIERAVALYK